MNIHIPSRDNNNTDKNIAHGYMGTGSLLYGIIPVMGGMGVRLGTVGYCQGAILFAPSDSFSLRRTVSPQYKTSQTDDRRHAVPKARPNTVGQKRSHKQTVANLR